MKSHDSGRWYVAIAAAVLHGGLAAGSLRSADEKPSPAGPKVRLDVTDAARLDVRAFWEQVTESEFNFHRTWDELRDFRPARGVATYGGADFRALLPPGPVAVGQLWELNGEGLLKFLRQIHPGATLKLHLNNGDSRGGGYGCLRACDDRWADVVFRAHAEFVLRGGYFTPGQFAGRLVLDRSSGTVAFFRLHLPPAPVNFDVGRRVTVGFKVGDKEVQEVRHATDAGSVPRLELTGGDEGALRAVERAPGRAMEEVTAAFARRFYQFKAIDWVDFDEAVAAARRSGKPLNVIALNGTLDDESC